MARWSHGISDGCGLLALIDGFSYSTLQDNGLFDIVCITSEQKNR